ncbi:Carbon monoxide dehydrogenase subunit G [Actinopolymorpha cephalotaxi]|uniref:Carbon monoxide dehydrogenase subunit G n=1 Tax=Actinopolymorpha cephalotaxi TaxID=504797 RepID=A0A1I2Z3C8_9ACTN|nr:SRPBCC family protein [Actinopolymorpha cephalotaxi]NYH81837.1 carbon monoxide dehydrogenase subunit G [Actinopolymorpha cephalotaxi]SFH32304.1 Carbon monoxide dehydrogenase subunit G [Actinopolymorpha cephalotaxi]
MEFSNTVRIERRPEDVFAFLSHFENLPRWNYALDRTERVGTGPVGVGAQYVQARTVPRSAVERFEVVEHRPDRAVAIRGLLGPFDTTSSYRLEPVGEATLLTNSMRLERPGILPLATLAGPRVRSAVAENLRVLKELLELGADRSST